LFIQFTKISLKVMKTKTKPFVVKASFRAKYAIQTEDMFHTEMAHRCLDMQKTEPEKKSTRRINMRVSSKSLKIKPRGIFSEIKSQEIFMVNIQRYFVFQNESNVLLLGIQEGDDKFILILQLKNSRVIDNVCDVIDSTKGDTIRGTSMVVPRDLEPEPRREEESSPKVLVKESEAPKENEEHVSEEESVKDEPDHEIYVTPQHHSPAPKSSPSSSKRINLIHDEELRVQAHLQRAAKPPKANRDSKPRPPVEIIYANEDTYVSCHPDCRRQTHDGYCDEWEEKEYHIQWDPKTGAKEVADGPIYMFVAHQKHSHYSARFTCESDSDTDSSFVGASSSTSSSTSLSSREKSLSEETKEHYHNERRISRQGGYYNDAFVGSNFHIDKTHDEHRNQMSRAPIGFEMAIKSDMNHPFGAPSSGRDVFSVKMQLGNNQGNVQYKEDDQISHGESAGSFHNVLNHAGSSRRDSGSVISRSTDLSIHNKMRNEISKTPTPDDPESNYRGREDNLSFGGTGRSIHSRGDESLGNFSFNLNPGVETGSIHSRETAPSILSSKPTDFGFTGLLNQNQDTGTESSIHSGRIGAGTQSPLGSLGYNFNGTSDNVSIQSGVTGRSMQSNNTDARRQLPSPGGGYNINTNEDKMKLGTFMDHNDRDSLNKTPTGEDVNSYTNGSVDLQVNGELGLKGNNYFNSNAIQGGISAKF
jgi:hypothetical protein